MSVDGRVAASSIHSDNSNSSRWCSHIIVLSKHMPACAGTLACTRTHAQTHTQAHTHTQPMIHHPLTICASWQASHSTAVIADARRASARFSGFDAARPPTGVDAVDDVGFDAAFDAAFDDGDRRALAAAADIEADADTTAQAPGPFVWAATYDGDNHAWPSTTNSWHRRQRYCRCAII